VATISPVPSSEALDLVTVLERMVGLVRGLNPPAIGMSLTAASTLRMLERSGPYRISELAANQSVTQPAMTQLVTRLERDGYAQRSSSDTDGRVVLVAITDAGRDFLRIRREARALRLTELMDALPPADRRQIVAAIPAFQLLADLGQVPDGSSAR
jgi:DNA-binding MarR family transcriptional regulator